MKLESLSPRVSTFRGVFLGTPDQGDGDSPEKLWRISDGESVTDCMVPRGELLRRLLSEPLMCHWIQIASWPCDSIAVLTDA